MEERPNLESDRPAKRLSTRDDRSVVHAPLVSMALAGAWALSCIGCAVDYKRSPPADELADADTADAGAADAGGEKRFYGPDEPWLTFQPCAQKTQRVELSPVDLLILQDISYSMDFDRKWTSVKSALISFLYSPDAYGLGVGLQYFPLRAQCSVDAYAQPAVPIGIVPALSPDLETSLRAQHMVGGTPTVPSVSGALQYAKAWASDHSDRRIVLILATDGIPDDTCVGSSQLPYPNSLDNVIKVVSDAATNSPTVATFVIGVGDNLSGLGAIAQAGANRPAFLVDGAQNTEKSFFDALAEIRRNAQSCELVIPPPDNGALNFDTVALLFTPDNGSLREKMSYVGGPLGCTNAPDHGWFYDDPVKPTKMILCPETCSRFIVEGAGGQLDAAYACRHNPS